MSPEDRRDISLEATPSLVPAKPSPLARGLANALRAGVTGAAMLAATLGVTNEAEARDVSDEELTEAATSLGFESVTEAIEHTMIDPRDVSTQLDPDGSGSMVFSYKRGTADLYHRSTPTGPDTMYPPVIVDEGEIPSGNYRAISMIGSTRVALPNGDGLAIFVDGRFREATRDVRTDNVHQVEIGGEQFMIYMDNSGDLVRIPVSVIEDWRPEDGDITVEIVAGDIDSTPNIVTLADGMVLAQGDSSLVKLINLATGEVENVNPDRFRSLFADGGSLSIPQLISRLRALTFHDDPSTPNSFWVEDPDAGTFQQFNFSYDLEEIPDTYTAVLTIDGTFGDLDIPVGTGIQIEGVDCDVSIMETATGGDLDIPIAGLTGSCTVLVNLTPPDGIEIDGPTSFEVTFNAEDPEEVLLVSFGNPLGERVVSVVLSAHNELARRSEIDASRLDETIFNEGQDSWVTGTGFEIFDSEVGGTGSPFTMTGPGTGYVTLRLLGDGDVECIIENLDTGQEHVVLIPGDNDEVYTNIAYATPLRPNASVTVDIPFDTMVGEIGADAFAVSLHIDGHRVDGTEVIFDGGQAIISFYAGDPETLAAHNNMKVVIESAGATWMTLNPNGETDFTERIEIPVTAPVRVDPSTHNVQGITAAGVRSVFIQSLLDGVPLSDARVTTGGKIAGHTDIAGILDTPFELVDENGNLDLEATVLVQQTVNPLNATPIEQWGVTGLAHEQEVDLSQISPEVFAELSTPTQGDGDNEEVGPGDVDAGGHDVVDDSDANDGGTTFDVANEGSNDDVPTEDANLEDTNGIENEVDAGNGGGSRGCTVAEGPLPVIPRNPIHAVWLAGLALIRKRR